MITHIWKATLIGRKNSNSPKAALNISGACGEPPPGQGILEQIHGVVDYLRSKSSEIEHIEAVILEIRPPPNQKPKAKI